MKKYQSPEIMITAIASQDIMTLSYEDTGAGKTVGWDQDDSSI